LRRGSGRRQQLSAPATATSGATLAINDRGDAIAAWSSNEGNTTSFRPADGGFGPPVLPSVAGPTAGGFAIALDALGDSIALRGDGQQGFGQFRSRDGAPEPEFAITERVDAYNLYSLNLAMDRFGNGIVVWTTYRDGRIFLRAAGYSAMPPTISGVRVSARKLRLRASEPARLRISVKRRGGSGRTLSQTTKARPGVNRLRLSTRVRRMLKRRGRYLVTIRSGDAGPRKATKRVRYRRR